MNRFLLAACIGLIAVLAGCRGDGDSGSPTPEFETQPLSPELQAMLEEVAAIRGLPVPADLSIGAVPRSRVVEFLDARLDDRERADMDQLTVLFRLQGHLPANGDFREAILQLLGEFAIGFYEPSDRTMWLVRNEIALDPADLTTQERSTLAHEFVHALQDNAFDLRFLQDDAPYGSDAGLARSAVIEGDAVAHERFWLESHLATAEVRVFMLASASSSALSPSIERELRFPYQAGLDWVGAVRAASGQQGIDRVLRDRRALTTAEIMHPTIRETGWQPATVELPNIAPALGDGWTQTASSTLGEFRLANYLQLWLPGLTALGAAQGWVGDRYTIYENKSRSVATFRVRFTTAKEAGEFAQAHLKLLAASGANVEQRAADDLGTHRDGRTVIQLRDTAQDEVIYVIGSDREVAEAAVALLQNL